MGLVYIGIWYALCPSLVTRLVLQDPGDVDDADVEGCERSERGGREVDVADVAGAAGADVDDFDGRLPVSVCELCVRIGGTEGR